MARVLSHVELARYTAGIIDQRGRILMVQQRARGDSGRHDGQLYVTLPGGVEIGESFESALAREIAEEVRLMVRDCTFLARVDHATSDADGGEFLGDVVREPVELGVDRGRPHRAFPASSV